MSRRQASKFIEDVRSSRVRHPTQPGFSIASWRRAFESAEDDSVDAQRLFDAGLWTFQQLERVRSELATAGLKPTTKDETIRLLVGLTNYIARRAAADVLKRSPNEYFVAAVTANAADDIIETVLDGVRYPLAAALSAPSDVEKRSDGANALNAARHSISLGTIYDAVERIWAQCLWLGWWMELADGENRAVPPDRELEKHRAVGVFRYSSIATEVALRSKEFWRSLPPDQRSIRYRRVVRVERVGKRKKLFIRDVEVDEPPQEWLFRVVAEEIYLRDTLDIPLHKLGDLTTRQLLDGWAGIAPLVELTAAEFPPDKADRRGDVLKYAPTFDKASIEEAVAHCADVSLPAAKTIVDALTLTGSPREEVWFRPFVPLSDGKLAVVVTALATPNLLRSIEEWLRRGGLDLGTRGFLFEKYLRSSLTRYNKLPQAYVHQGALKTDVGDIDVCVQVGATMVIAELKCSLFPASPIEQYTYEETLANAAEQARRKVTFVQANPEQVFSQMGRAIPAECLRVLPVVISNLPLGAGRTFDDVPVVDVPIFTKFFSEGFLQQLVITHASRSRDVGVRTRFYETPDRAEATIATYLHDPPQVTTVLGLVRQEIRPLFKRADGETVTTTSSQVDLHLPKAPHRATGEDKADRPG